MFFDGAEWREGVIEGMPRLDGVVIGGFTDHHVHLQLVDHALLAGSRLGRVVDLGGALRLAPLAQEPGVAVEFAGAFLTAPGGYPSDRSWAPPGSWREIADDADALAAVTEMADAGATRIKVTSNSNAGPVLGDDLIRAVVAAASAHDLPVVLHAEGPGQAQRAARLGVSTLAHAPFTERLSDDEIAEQAASLSWISTLAIHEGADRETAIDNVRRFHAAGGTVLYGTDMGNGPTPVDLNPAELAALREACVEGIALLRALAPQDPRDAASVRLLLPSPDSDPASARVLTAADLKV